jgi:FkbM family methyltransferase
MRLWRTGRIDQLCLSVGDGGYNSTVKAASARRLRRDSSAISLQRIFDQNDIRKCDFMKMDCEGAEYAIVNALPAAYWRMFASVGFTARKRQHTAGCGPART